MIHLFLLQPVDGASGLALQEPWVHGTAQAVWARVADLQQATDTCEAVDDDRFLFWDPSLGSPQRVVDWLRSRSEGPDPEPGEIFHAGLMLGQAASPPMLDFVHPTWMLQRDPTLVRASSSWRVSLRACLVPVGFWRCSGGLGAGFDTLAAAGLELGFRWWRQGALMRHVPAWVDRPAEPRAVISAADELRCVEHMTGRFWARWAAMRSWRHGDRALRELPAASRSSIRVSRGGGLGLGAPTPSSAGAQPAPVGVLIPTLDRYPYLEVVLDQLQHQTVPPRHVVVVDQTEPGRRRRDWHRAYPDLSLTVIEQDRPGQSTARNAGLRRLDTERVLFLDDDVEIEPDLIARHSAVLDLYGADVSCGVTEEVGAGALPEEFLRRRLADVFPTCNCMATRDVLMRSGLFDLAFDFGPRADADLGMRIYLAGGLMVLEPSIRVLHHKAPSGGLRRHKARVVTYADSRRRLWARHLPHATELYLARRYFTGRQAGEARLLRLLGTLRGRGSALRRVLKGVIGLALWPHSSWKVRQAQRRADELACRFPQIPQLDEPAP